MRNKERNMCTPHEGKFSSQVEPAFRQVPFVLPKVDEADAFERVKLPDVHPFLRRPFECVRRVTGMARFR